jgi:DNA-binding CsgD family transcriptional regulator
MGALKPIAGREVPVSEPVTQVSRPRSSAASPTGFVLADLDFRLVYANSAGLQILSYPRDLRGASPIPIVQKRIRSIFTVDRFNAHLQATRFLSGRRRYVCRPFLLESPDRPSMAALVLERHNRDLVHLGDVGQRFRLSRRECETVQHLVLGLTTKEVAKRMGVSPNTIKQFVRLVMSKMGVTTRSGIVGKLIDH